MSSSLLAPFLGALQASLSVILIVLSGCIAAQFALLSDASTKDISKTCVRLLLPALLVTKVGAEIRQDTGMRYVPIFVWCVVYNGVLMLYGWAAVRVFKMPTWVTPAIAFNNTTALPLLLINSLESAGILDTLLVGGDTAGGAMERAKTYLLVNSVVSNCLTFAVGPQLLNAHEEDAPSQGGEKEGGSQGATRTEDEENGQDDNQRGDEDEDADEETSLLPDAIDQRRRRLQNAGYGHGKRHWDRMPSWIRVTLDFLFQFINGPVIATAIGLFIGLIPPIQKAFFAKADEGGIFNAWVTTSLQNLGSIFAALQTLTVGVKLATALKDMKQSSNSSDDEDDSSSSAYPWIPSLFVEVTRHVVCPVLSIPVIWLVATKTSWLSDDPILWFTMMLMPTGPPALKLAALADVSNYKRAEKLAISKFLAVSYCVSWTMAFAVVGCVKATQAAIEEQRL